MKGDHDVFGIPKVLQQFILRRVDDESWPLWEDQVLDGHEVRMGKIEASGFQFQFLAFPGKDDSIDRQR